MNITPIYTVCFFLNELLRILLYAHSKETVLTHEKTHTKCIFKTITTTNTHHIQECLLKGKWLRCIMDLSLGTPGHCPGFIPKLCQSWSPYLLTFHPFSLSI